MASSLLASSQPIMDGFVDLLRRRRSNKTRTDLLSSMVLLEPPVLHPSRFVAANYYTYFGRPSTSTTVYATNLKARFLHFTRHLQSSDDAARIFWGLRNVSILKTTASSTDSASARDMHFSDRCELLEREVQQLLHRALRDSNAEPEKSNLIFTLFARASLLYIYSMLRDLLMNVKMFEELGNILEESMDIDDKDLNLLLGTFPDLMLWMLFLGGGMAALSRKIWYAKTAGRILRVWKVEDNMIKGAATAFLWPEGRENYDDSLPSST